jgi:hypothetical protein
MNYEIDHIQEQAVTKCEESGSFVVEASCLEFPPGRFPRCIIYKGVEYSYYKKDMTDSGEDLAGVIYRHGGGPHGAEPYTELLVIND